MRHTNIHEVGVPAEERGKGAEQNIRRNSGLNLLKMMRTFIYIPSKLNKLQVQQIQTDPHPYTP